MSHGLLVLIMMIIDNDDSTSIFHVFMFIALSKLQYANHVCVPTLHSIVRSPPHRLSQYVYRFLIFQMK